MTVGCEFKRPQIVGIGTINISQIDVTSKYPGWLENGGAGSYFPEFELYELVIAAHRSSYLTGAFPDNGISRQIDGKPVGKGVSGIADDIRLSKKLF